MISFPIGIFRLYENADVFYYTPCPAQDKKTYFFTRTASRAQIPLPDPVPQKFAPGKCALPGAPKKPGTAIKLSRVHHTHSSKKRIRLLPSPSLLILIILPEIRAHPPGADIAVDILIGISIQGDRVKRG